MREICLSGCVSSEGWHVQQEKGLPGQKSKPRSLDSRGAGNQDSEAYRQRLPRGGAESRGRNNRERKGGLEREQPRGPSPQPEGEGSMGSRNLIDAAPTLRRGGRDSTVTRTCRATGEALLVPRRNHRSRVDRITGSTGKSIEGERVTDGFEVALRRGNARTSEGALLFVTSPTTRKARTR